MSCNSKNHYHVVVMLLGYILLPSDWITSMEKQKSESLHTSNVLQDTQHLCQTIVKCTMKTRYLRDLYSHYITCIQERCLGILLDDSYGFSTTGPA